MRLMCRQINFCNLCWIKNQHWKIMIHNYILFALWMYLNESDELQVKQNRKGFNQLAPSDEKCKLKLIEDLAKVDSWWLSRSRTALCGRQKFKRRQSEMNYHWLKLLPGAPVDTNHLSKHAEALHYNKWSWEWVVDRPTQLVCIWIFICQRTNIKDIAE